MRLKKDITNLSKMNDINDDEYVNASAEERIEMAWGITLELWSQQKET